MRHKEVLLASPTDFLQNEKSSDNGLQAQEVVYTTDGKVRDEWEVDEIVQSRSVGNGNVEYLVKWKGFTKKDNTWEPAEHLRNADELVTEFDVKFPDAP